MLLCCVSVAANFNWERARYVTCQRESYWERESERNDSLWERYKWAELRWVETARERAVTSLRNVNVIARIVQSTRNENKKQKQLETRQSAKSEEDREDRRVQFMREERQTLSSSDVEERRSRVLVCVCRLPTAGKTITTTLRHNNNNNNKGSTACWDADGDDDDDDVMMMLMQRQQDIWNGVRASACPCVFVLVCVCVCAATLCEVFNLMNKRM